MDSQSRSDTFVKMLLSGLGVSPSSGMYPEICDCQKTGECASGLERACAMRYDVQTLLSKNATFNTRVADVVFKVLGPAAGRANLKFESISAPGTSGCAGPIDGRVEPAVARSAMGTISSDDLGTAGVCCWLGS
mmetsp:Transcript_96218/g.310412  ORF Transcript_96218/g.310412 Transcript_96218/m.310412 type:complete len:134 (-) Transcript_96218:255-656(-)